MRSDRDMSLCCLVIQHFHEIDIFLLFFSFLGKGETVCHFTVFLSRHAIKVSKCPEWLRYLENSVQSFCAINIRITIISHTCICCVTCTPKCCNEQ